MQHKNKRIYDEKITKGNVKHEVRASMINILGINEKEPTIIYT
jgi:hypothetical protein